MKPCLKCGNLRPLSQFHKSKRRAHVDGLNTICKLCVGPGQRERMLAKKYGISQADYEAMLQAQDGKCAICGSEKSFSMGSFMIDHDHSHHPHGQGCKECIRGLLCNKCNVMEQWLEDHWGTIHAYLSRRPLLVL